MKFAIFNEIEKGKRKFLIEMDQEQVEDALVAQMDNTGTIGNIRKAFRNVIEEFKKESIRIP